MLNLILCRALLDLLFIFFFSFFRFLKESSLVVTADKISRYLYHSRYSPSFYEMAKRRKKGKEKRKKREKKKEREKEEENKG